LVTQLITNFSRKKININNCVIHIMLFVLLLLFALQSSAETNYLYASDIIDRDNRSIYNSNPARRYSRQGEPSYPNDVRKYIQPGQQQQYYFTEQNHYNAAPIQMHNSDTTEVYRYPTKNNNNYTDHFAYDQTMRGKALMIPDRSNEQYRSTSSGLLYVSDLEPTRSIRQKNNAIRRENQSQCCPSTSSDSIRYISAPMRNASVYNRPNYNQPIYNEPLYNNEPKALPARMPGYNLFSSDYNRNVLNNVYDVPYNSFSGVGSFPVQRTLFRNNR